MTKIVVQLPESIRRRAEALAASDGVTMDQLLATALAEKIAVLEAVNYISARASRADGGAFLRVLGKVPERKVEEDWDRMPD